MSTVGIRALKQNASEVIRRAAAGDVITVRDRTPDALHLATAVELGESCTGIITYDKQLAEAATAAGLDVFAPR